MNAYTQRHGIRTQQANEKLAQAYCILNIVNLIPYVDFISSIASLVILYVLFNNYKIIIADILRAKSH
jgi:hypothetical protein